MELLPLRVKNVRATARTLTLGTDNGSAFTARAFKAVLVGLGIAHRRGGYRDSERQAFIESWFGKLKERCVWRHEFETLDHARVNATGEHVSRPSKHAPVEATLSWRRADRGGGEKRCAGDYWDRDG